MGYCTEEAVLKALATEVGLDYVDLTEAQVDLSLLKDFPPKMLHRQALFPVRRENGSLIVATSDPFDLYPLDELSASTGLTVVPVLASRAEIAKLIKTALGRRQRNGHRPDGAGRRKRSAAERDRNRRLRAVGNGARSQRHSAGERNPARGDRVASQRRSHRAAGRRHCGFATASTVCCTRSRCRRKSLAFRRRFISRLKIMSRLNIAEKRLPQDGRIKLSVRGREVDVRVSVIPMIHGEGIVMRILDKGSMEFKLQKLGMEEDLYDTFQQLIRCRTASFW